MAELDIQRYPRGLADLLDLFGGTTPRSVADQIRATIDCREYYGKTQWQQRSATNAALAEAGILTLTVPGSEHWILFHLSMFVAKTTTMTALRTSLLVGPDSQSVVAIHATEQGLGPFGATEGGGARECFCFPYPFILPPGGLILGALDILGTDATANCTLSASIGVLG